MKTPPPAHLTARGWLRVSNAGLTEEAQRVPAPVQQHEAEMRLVAENMIQEQTAGTPWTKSEQSLIGLDPYLPEYYVGRMVKVSMNASGPEMRAFNQATSIAQQAALMQSWVEREKTRAQRLNAR